MLRENITMVIIIMFELIDLNIIFYVEFHFDISYDFYNVAMIDFLFVKFAWTSDEISD